MAEIIDRSKHYRNYDELPVLDSKNIDPKTYLIVPEGVGNLPKLQKLLNGYKQLARQHPPSWRTYSGQDIEARAHELLAQDCPDLRIWRGGNFAEEKRDYSFQLSHAVGWTYGTFGGERPQPVLIGVPLKEVVEAYKQEKILIGGSGLSVGAIGIVPYLHPIDMDNLFTHQIYRMPSHLTPNEQNTWVSDFIDKTSQKSGTTHIDHLYSLVSDRLSKD